MYFLTGPRLDSAIREVLAAVGGIGPPRHAQEVTRWRSGRTINRSRFRLSPTALWWSWSNRAPVSPLLRRRQNSTPICGEQYTLESQAPGATKYTLQLHRRITLPSHVVAASEVSPSCTYIFAAGRMKRVGRSVVRFSPASDSRLRSRLHAAAATRPVIVATI